MNTVAGEFKIGGYLVMKINGGLPTSPYNVCIVDGKHFKLVPAYDAPNCIAIKANDSFIGKEVSFALM